jgi:transposase
MDSTKYAGMDVHKETISIAVVDSTGKLVKESILEAKANTILEFILALHRNVHVTFEEGTWAAWLYDLLKPHVTKVVVCNPRMTAWLSDGNKDDKSDARKLAELLRGNFLRPVYHGETGIGTLKELTRSYLAISKDLIRVMNRLKALYRSRGIACGGTLVYAPRHRSEWLGRITEAGGRRRAEHFYQELDALQALRKEVRRDLLAESQKHSATELLCQIPCIGPIRAAQLIALNPDAPPFSHQAAALDLQRSWVGNTRQRAIPLRRRTAATFQETAATPWTQSESQPRSQKYFQGRCNKGQHLRWTIPRFLRGFAHQGQKASHGTFDLGAEDCSDHVDSLEERSEFRRPTREATGSLSVSSQKLGSSPGKIRV